MKRIALFSAGALLVLTLAGCAGQQSAGQAEFIGLDAAKAVALDDAGVQAASASFSTTGLDRRNGIDYYAVDFTCDGVDYSYDIDAITGVVIDYTTSGDDGTAAQDSQTSTTPAVTTSDTPSTTAPSATTPAANPTPAGQATAGSSNSQGTGITADQAKEYALAHAGLSSNEVTFVKCKLDWEDGRQIYEVEFYGSDYTEYDYEIDASTGNVVKYDYDAEYALPQSSSGQSITADEAKEKALSQVPGATVNDIYDFEVDYDDGRLRYEGKILYDGMEYEFEIDGYSGSIQGWESEPFGR